LVSDLRIAVLGVGLIGGSIGLAARRDVAGVEVAGFDRDPAVLEAARERGAISHAAGSVAEAVADADACFVCAPVGALPGLVEEALAAARADCVVTDVGSTKRLIAAAVSDERFVGGHPIAGSESAGVQHARADMFQGAAWYLTPGERSSGVLYNRLHALLVAIGARPVALDAESHDRLLATVSHLPHVVANVLVSQAARTVDREDESLPRVGPSFRDVTRVAGANSAIWADIYMQNAAAIADEIDATVERLSGVAAALRAGDEAAIRDWNERAAEDRRRLLEADLEGGPAHQLRVTVPNKPGIVAQLALALGRGGVNIADMALAPAPDNRSGAITFWVTGEGAAERAARLIEGQGFPVLEDA
jgi:prephenate dehydrogenase